MGETTGFRQIAKPGEVIFREGEAGDAAYLIESGAIDVIVGQGANAVRVAKLGRGDMLGEMAMIDGSPRSGTAIARKRSALLVITGERLSRRVAQTDPVLRLCLGVLVQRLRHTTAQASGRLPVWRPVPGHADVRSALLQEEAIHDAIAAGAFEPFFQPIVDLTTRAVVGYEVLARWSHPERGLLRPAAFIPDAEATGLVGAIDRQVRHRACFALASLSRAGGGANKPYLSLNVSAVDFADPGFVGAMRAMIKATGADPRRLRLEITETALIADPITAARRLQQCRAIGFGIAIDDFGTGHASLSYLHQLPVDAIKIDRGFVCGSTQDGKHRVIARSIVRLATDLGLTTIAEGIETPAQHEAMLDLGCGYGQGYLFGRPGPCGSATGRSKGKIGWQALAGGPGAPAQR